MQYYVYHRVSTNSVFIGTAFEKEALCQTALLMKHPTEYAKWKEGDPDCKISLFNLVLVEDKEEKE